MDGSRLFFFVGKGGVGKTSVSSAFALMLSERGINTLLLSTDPAHSLSDVLGVKVGSEVKSVKKNFAALEIDPIREAESYLSEALKRIEALVNPDTFSKVKDMFHLLEDSPGLLEAALTERLSRTVLETDYDALVVDTAPTGHTLQMLGTVSRIGSWIEELIKNRQKSQRLKEAAGKGKEDDELLRALRDRRVRLEAFREKVFSKDTTFLPILNPERLPILETRRAVDKLKTMGLGVNVLVVNKVMDRVPEEEFFKRRKAVEDMYLNQIEELFPDLDKIFIPLMEEDVRGLGMLNKVARVLEESWKSL